MEVKTKFNKLYVYFDILWYPVKIVDKSGLIF